MSNATTTPRQPGEPKRRRSRGGKNRNKQHQDGRRETSHRTNPPRAEEFRPRAERSSQPTSAGKPSLLQRVLMFLGLRKKPAASPPVSKSAKPRTEPRPPKSNTRNARSQEHREEAQPKPQEPRPRREKSERPRGGDRSSVESNRVYVGNLSYDVSEQDLQELFKGVGPVREVEIVYNRTTHRSKGYGFVEMVHRDEAVRAVEVLHDQFFMGRKMVVSGAKSKGQDEREDQESRADRPARPVVLAPLPPTPADPAPSPAPPSPVANHEEEPTIQTIVETVAHSAEPCSETPVCTEPATEPETHQPVAAEETAPKQA